MQRLSTLYNADVGLYMLANKVVDSGKDVGLFILSGNLCFLLMITSTAFLLLPESWLTLDVWILTLLWNDIIFVTEILKIFNALYMQWMVDEKELRVIHYTLGPLKPWDWWTAWLVKPVDLWQVLQQSCSYCFYVCLLFVIYHDVCHHLFLMSYCIWLSVLSCLKCLLCSLN